jgi:hypothetical protein
LDEINHLWQKVTQNLITIDKKIIVTKSSSFSESFSKKILHAPFQNYSHQHLRRPNHWMLIQIVFNPQKLNFGRGHAICFWKAINEHHSWLLKVTKNLVANDKNYSHWVIKNFWLSQDWWLKLFNRQWLNFERGMYYVFGKLLTNAILGS